MKPKNNFFHRFIRSKDIKLYGVLLLLFLIFTLIIFTYSSNITSIDTSNRYAKPSVAYPLGTDELGRNIFLRVLYGGFVSLSIGLFATVLSCIIGTFIGVLCGYLGGIIDDILMRLMEIILSIPWLILVTTICLFFKSSVTLLIFIIGGTTWMELARIVRAEALIIKKQDYVLFSSINGANFIFVLWRHIIPNILPTIFVTAIVNMSSAILAETSLSFIGLGVKQPLPSLGGLLQSAQGNMLKLPQLIIIPGLLIVFIVHSLNKIAQAAEKSMYPQESNLL